MKSRIVITALLAACISLPALAQGGSGMGGGMGPGMGGGQGNGRFAFDQGNTSGWSLMTAEEQQAHRQKMRNVKTFDECKARQAEHHTAMTARAQEKGQALPAPRANACERMQARGLFK